MRLKSKFLNKTLSVLLSLSVAVTALIPCSLTAFADSGGGAGSVSPTGDGGKFYISSDYDQDIIKISASKINDNTTDDGMASIANRYGDLRGYPIFMMVGNVQSHATAFGQDTDARIANLRAEADRWKKYTRGGNSPTIYEYMENSENSRGIFKFEASAESCKSIYIEDCLAAVVSKYQEKNITSLDAECFWYFYTRMAYGANSDRLYPESDTDSDLGETLSEYITDAKNGYSDKNKHERVMQRGYVVALTCIYGWDSTPVQKVTGSKFKKIESISEVLSESWKNDYVSLLVDRMLAVDMGGGSFTANRVAFTPLDHLKYYKRYSSYSPSPVNLNSDTLEKENLTMEINHHLAGHNGNDIACISNFYRPLLKAIYPKREIGNNINILNSAGKRIYGGWGYYPFKTEPVEPVPSKVTLINEDKTRIATEVTYNAYLTDKTSGVDFAEQAKFSADSHVMTDTVYYSDMYEISHLGSSINDNGKYLFTTVDKSIKLSAPVENTTYNLYRMQYQITNAGGENSSFNYNNSNEKTRTLMKNNTPIKATESELNNSTIYVRGSDINYATGDWVNGVWKPSEFRVRIKKEVGNKLKSGEYVKNGVNYKYPVYAYKSINGSNKRFRIVYSLTNSAWKNATTKQIADYVSGVVNYKFKLKDGSTYYDFDLPRTFKSNFGSFDATDIDGNTLNLFFVKTPDDEKYWPFICTRTGTDVKFTHCLLARYRNLLVQIKADYIASFAEGTENYNNTYKSVNMPSYLVAQNVGSDEFTKKDLYTMLDMYNTNHWGTITHSNFSTYADNGDNVTLPVTQVNSSGTSYYGGVSSSYRDWAATQTDSNTKIKYGSNLSGNVRKVSYYAYTTKDVPMFGKVNYRIDRNLKVNARMFKNNKYTGGIKNIKLSDTIFWTAQKGINTYDDQTATKSVSEARAIESDGKYIVPSEGDIGQWGECNNANMVTKDTKTGIAYYSPSGVYTYAGKYNKVGSDGNTKYVENYFTKMLVHYENYTYDSKANTTAAPTLASWMNASMDGFNSSALPSSMHNTTADKGFIRFGQVAIKTGTNGIADEVALENNKDNNRYLYRTIKNILTIDNVDKSTHATGIHNIETYSGLSRTVTSVGSTYDSKTFTFGAPITQSAYDIPLKYNLRVKTGENKDKQALKTYYKKSGKTISMLYQYSAEDINNGLYKFGGDSTSWKYNKVSIGVYPEVRMWAEKDFTGNSSKHKPTSASDYNSVATVGTRMRYIPATTYTTLDLSGLNVDAQVMGTAVAYDTRAKKLAQALGSADTQVIYSGTAVNGTISSKASGTLKTYALDFRSGGVLNGQDIKTGWKNNNYDSKNVASKAMSVVLDQFKVNSSANMAIYNGKTLTNVDVGISSTTGGDLSASSPVNGNVRYNLYIRGSQIYQVAIFTKVGNGYVEAIRYRFIDPDGNNETTGGYKKLVETGTNKSFWYNTGSCKIKAVNGKYIYNGTTELTATEKANYLAIYNGNADVTKSTFTTLRTLLTNMRLYGNYNVLANTFEYNTGVDLPNGLKNSTGGTKSYNEDCSVLQIREYTATVTSGDSKSTFTEQIPINAGPSTPIDKNKYFSNGYKAFVNASVKVVAKNDLKNSTDDIIVAKNAVFASDVVKHKVKDSTTKVVVDNASKAKTAIPDFIIGDVPISEALSG